MLIDTSLVIAGLILLFAGAEWLVGHSVLLAKRLGIPVFVIAATIVGFGTSTPELLVSLRAALSGSPDIAAGNVVGSNIANILLIAGIGALITPLSMPRSSSMTRDALFLAGLTAVLIAIALTGTISRFAGAAMILTLSIYLFLSLRSGPSELAEHEVDDISAAKSRPAWVSAVIAVIGLLAVLGGADLLVRGATDIASAMGISEAIIGLTVVAVGTSLPELAATISAARKRHADVVLGNIVGSNIFNIVGILGITAMVSPLPTTGVSTPLTLATFGASGLFLAYLLYTGSRMGRVSGGVCLAAYLAYTASLFV